MTGRLLLWVIAIAAIGCDSQEDAVVGAKCTQNAQCRFQCETDPQEFPGGFCTVNCTSDGQCPHGTVCVEQAGGVCVFTCANSTDCVFLGDGWQCLAKDRPGGGKVKVCVGN